MEHEALVLLAGDVLDLLLVVGRAERAADERLRLAAREDDRAVHAREDAGLGPDRADLVELPAVEAHAALERLVAHRLFLKLVEDVLGVLLLLRLTLGQRREQVVEHGVDLPVALELLLDAHRVGQRTERLLLDLLIELGGDRLGRDHDLLLADRGLQILDGRDDLLDRGMRGFERADDLRFRDFLGAGLDHHDAVASCRRR